LREENKGEKGSLRKTTKYLGKRSVSTFEGKRAVGQGKKNDEKAGRFNQHAKQKHEVKSWDKGRQHKG